MKNVVVMASVMALVFSVSIAGPGCSSDSGGGGETDIDGGQMDAAQVDSGDNPDATDAEPVDAGYVMPEVQIVASATALSEYDEADFEAEITGGQAPFDVEWDFDGVAPASYEINTGAIQFVELGEYTVTVTVVDAEGNDASDSVQISVDILAGNMNFYFGNLHSHSGISDGEGTPTEVLTWAKYDEELDFYLMTDHAEQIFGSEWDLIATRVDEFTEDGVFVSLRGFEWSHPVNGHICVYETDDYTAAYSSLWISDFYDWIEANDGMGQFNHPGREYQVFNDLQLETNVISHMFAIETGNKNTGNNDGEFVPYYIQALDNGWHVAPTNNQDNHSLSINSHRTVYIGEELTKAHLLEAMHARRLYSSDDPNIKIVFKYKDKWMGSHVDVTDNNVRFSIKVEDDEPVQEMQLVTKEGTVVADMEPGEEDDPMSIFWFPEVTVNESSYFFLKVISEDIHDDDGPVQIALTAPIWINIQ